ncbi:hypothetical protein CRG98_024463 [Punica granatum]|uniref:Uncharacterized protein n=1 Tax=Punica granatum TaxID=22663 RepID=A0A2I0JFX7_PUNGR|nr:hypothetical protein CRG98_024463 [Punica granatum]
MEKAYLSGLHPYSSMRLNARTASEANPALTYRRIRIENVFTEISTPQDFIALITCHARRETAPTILSLCRLYGGLRRNPRDTTASNTLETTNFELGFYFRTQIAIVRTFTNHEFYTRAWGGVDFHAYACALPHDRFLGL